MSERSFRICASLKKTLWTAFRNPLPHDSIRKMASASQDMNMDENYSDEFLRDLLTSVKTFASVGISVNPVRPSYFVGRYLSLKGYRVIPVNPAYSGQTLFGETVLENLNSIPLEADVDVLDIFRKHEEVPALVECALDRFPKLKVVWMQYGISHPEAAKMARARGVAAIQNRCPKIEYQRLFSELRMAGLNTGIISSRLFETS